MNRKIIIEKSGVKREIEFPFHICLSRESAQWLRDQLRQMCVDDDATYGWITIPNPADERQLVSTPRPWVDPPPPPFAAPPAQMVTLALHEEIALGLQRKIVELQSEILELRREAKGRD